MGWEFEGFVIWGEGSSNLSGGWEQGANHDKFSPGDLEASGESKQVVG